jgi:hypothetical protein
MNISSISDIKKELQHATKEELLDYCIRLIKFKKENKELANYFLFEEAHKEQYVKNVKVEVSTLFDDVNTSNVFLAKKTLRKIIRYIQKQIKYTQDHTIETQILLHFCEQFVALNINIRKYPVLVNMYESHVNKIHKAIAHLHEDLQHDYISTIAVLK